MSDTSWWPEDGPPESERLQQLGWDQVWEAIAHADETTNNCLVKGQTLTGTGNLAGTIDPKLRTDGHILWDSPLRGTGGTIAQSRIDIDGELRPSAAPERKRRQRHHEQENGSHPTHTDHLSPPRFL